MPPIPGPSPHEPQVEAETPGASTAPSPTSQDDKPLTVASSIQKRDNKSLLLMPVEIIAIILIKWSMLDWFAPAIARQICRRLKGIAECVAHAWANLSVPLGSPATADDVRAWLRRAKKVPKEIHLDAEDIGVITATLEGAVDATSLIYKVATHKYSRPYRKELVLDTPMPQLRHLHLHAYNDPHLLSLSGILGRSCDVAFSCLTVLHLVFVDLADFHITPGLFPAVRRLILYSTRGPILDLVQGCSGSVEELRAADNDWYDTEPPQDDRILLPNLKVLILNRTPGIVPRIEAPTLRLIYGGLGEIGSITVPFNSVVECATRRQRTNVANNLINMPQLRHLVICQQMEPLKWCFESLRDTPSICPDLQHIEVIVSGQGLDVHFREFLLACMAQRAEQVPGFTLDIFESHVQWSRFLRYDVVYVCLFIIIGSLIILPFF